MRAQLSVAALILLAGCSKTPEHASFDTSSDSAPQGAVANAPPGINVTSAPGVAFNYDYRFQLPPEKVAAAQEAHQQACERLTIAHCRITGWHYRVVGENDIQGTLNFLLDPAMARGFGKAAVAEVARAGGSLAEAEITGTDAGAQIRAARAQQGQAGDEVARIDHQLARAGLPRGERETLQQQRADAAERARAASDQAATSQASLATTPMTFDYGSDATIHGFDASAPFSSAGRLALASVQITLATLLSLLAFAGPPALVLLALWWLVRAGRRRWQRGTPPAGG